jgi:hypothetical protein
MKRNLNRIIFLLAVVVAVTLPGAADRYTNADEFDDSVQALQWRNIGPFNGGRGTSVVGHPTDRNVFWFGHSSGGLWKTEDAGAYWTEVGAGQFK